MKPTKMITKNVSKIVAEDFRTAAVFSNYDIDFCCNGGISLMEICRKKGIEPEQILKDLDEAGSFPPRLDYQSFTQEELIDHVIEVHHHYVRNTLTILGKYLEKLCKVHGEKRQELFEIKKEFDQASLELSQHMDKEERVLFPYLIAMQRALKNDYHLSPPHFGNVDNPMKDMEREHQTEGDRFKRMRELSNDFKPPLGACQTYKVTYEMLKEFESDLHTHIHLENNIIFPRGRDMYNQLFSIEA